MIKNRVEYMTAYTGVIEEDKLYTVHEGLGLLMVFDLRDYSYKILKKIQLEKEKQWVRVKGMTILENVIYMIFECSWNIWEYHIDTGEIKINGKENVYKDGIYKVERVFTYENNIWLFPCYINEQIRVFDTKNKTYSLKKSIGAYLKENGYPIEKMCYGDYASSGDGTIYAITYECHYVISINLELNEYKMVDLGKEKKIARIVYDGKSFWMSFADSGKIIKWNFTHGIEKQYLVSGVLVDERGLPIQYIYEGKDKLFIIPSYMQKIILMDKKSGEIEDIEYPDDYKKIRKNRIRYEFYEELIYKNYIIALPFNGNKILKIDIDNQKIDFIDTKLNKEDIVEYILKEELQKKVITELDGYGLTEFIDYIIE